MVLILPKIYREYIKFDEDVYHIRISYYEDENRLLNIVFLLENDDDKLYIVRNLYYNTDEDSKMLCFALMNYVANKKVVDTPYEFIKITREPEKFTLSFSDNDSIKHIIIDSYVNLAAKRQNTKSFYTEHLLCQLD